MKQINPNQDNSSSYFMDASDVRELTRLLTLDKVITTGMDGPLSEQGDLSHIRSVLDIGCGPGEWALAVARCYPHMHVTGVDNSVRMVEYATAQAQARRLQNVSFRVVNALMRPWPFSDHPFDVINGRLMMSFLSRNDWVPLLKECVKLLSPGGIVRITEAENTFTSGDACERINTLICQAFHLAGQGFSPHGERFGSTLYVRSLLREAGLSDIRTRAHAIDCSHGEAAGDAYAENIKFTYRLIVPFLTKFGHQPEAEYEPLYQRAMEEMQDEDFKALMFLLTAWGRKS